MLVSWKGTFVGEWKGKPTLKEMRKVKAQLGSEFKHPDKFIAAATALWIPEPVIDPDTGKPATDNEGQPLFLPKANEDWDPDACAMFVSLVYSRAGHRVGFEEIDGTYEDLEVEYDEEEKAKIAKVEEELGKAHTPEDPPATAETPGETPATTSTSTTSSEDTPEVSGTTSE